MNAEDRAAYEHAERFWALQGAREPFPRSLEAAILWSYPIAIVRLPRLATSGIRDWLARRAVAIVVGGGCRRRLRACLVARGGTGVVFLDGSDPEPEQRYSLAHELAHFLLDYLWPRQHALQTLGERVRDVLDGLRPPSIEERLSAILRNVRLGTYAHFLERTAAGDIISADVLAAEDRADRLAVELLAPLDEVSRRVVRRGRTGAPRMLSAISTVLVRDFGLPEWVATSYAERIESLRRGRRSFREWLTV